MRKLLFIAALLLFVFNNLIASIINWDIVDHSRCSKCNKKRVLKTIFISIDPFITTRESVSDINNIEKANGYHIQYKGSIYSQLCDKCYKWTMKKIRLLRKKINKY